MPRSLPCILLALMAGWVLPLLGHAQAPAPDPLAALRSEVGALLEASKAPGATWAFQVASAETGAVWLERDPARLMVPASNTKLFTVALALDRFGTNAPFGTEWRWAGSPDAAGTLHGNVWLMAGGDPAPGGGLAEPRALAGLVDALALAGVRRIQGRLLLLDAWFEAPPFGPGWNWDDLPEAYGAPVAGFQWADNAVTIVVEPGATVGSFATVRTLPIPEAFELESSVRTVASNAPARVGIRRTTRDGDARFRISGEVRIGRPHVERMAVPDASAWLALGLKEALRQRGIAHDGILVAEGTPPRTDDRPSRARVVSSPMPEIAALCLKPSNNRIAHGLWLQVGADVRRNPRPGESGPRAATGSASDDNDLAARAMDRFMERMGVARGDVVLEEGSGLSRKNLVTPRATIRLLRQMTSGPAAGAWMAAMPVGGVDGTLRARFGDAATKGRVLAKTGTLRHVNSLAGYVTTAAGQRLVFALYVNGHVAPDHPGRGMAEIDAIVRRLATFAGQGPK